ncbi:MAG: hypothetical protein AAGG09_11825 [Pseudomonadota bacterium]
MKLGEDIIALGGTERFFDVANPSATGLTAPPLRRGDAVRTWDRSLSGFQKEALVVSARSGKMWRFVSDEGAYLSGHDAAPCPLSFLTAGIIASDMNEITALAAQRQVTLRSLKLTQNNHNTMQGSMRRRTMVGSPWAPWSGRCSVHPRGRETQRSESRCKGPDRTALRMPQKNSLAKCRPTWFCASTEPTDRI